MRSSEAMIQQERLQAIAEKRKRQTEIENKRRQLEDDRRQLQYLKSKALREKWLLEGAPSSTTEEDEALKKQMKEDEQRTKELDEAVQRLEKELELLENGLSATSTKESLAEDTVREEEKVVVVDHVQKIPLNSTKDVHIHTSPGKARVESELMKTAMYSVEITVEKHRVTGETKVLSTTTLLPQDLSQQGVKVYEDETKVVHEVRQSDGVVQNGCQLLSSDEVEELIHKADEVTLSEASVAVEKDAKGTPEIKVPSPRKTPAKEITGVAAKPLESINGPDVAHGKGGEEADDQPVTMIFMGYQNVEDEDETKKVLGLEGTVKAELVVIEDAENKVPSPEKIKQDSAPPNGNPTDLAAEPQKQENQEAEKPSVNDKEPEGVGKDAEMKEKHPCKCCTVM
ncbi:paralemmin-1 isoform X2 [Protopterus annectens]|uniref:paralemmin-1 isoform X2 n=2 Tax=Protopterus annectens TaxID=7888 RepID=UPI001CFB12B4|nr:paralemmin-1 isoform X2 [Protopterus annectens]